MPSNATYAANSRHRLPASAPSHQLPTLAANGTLKFPNSVLGYSFRPRPNEPGSDVDWTDWDSLNTFTLNPRDGSPVKVPFDWTHSFLYEVGATRTIATGKLSRRYIYTKIRFPRLLSPIVPDSARKYLSVGVGGIGNLNIDLAYDGNRC